MSEVNQETMSPRVKEMFELISILEGWGQTTERARSIAVNLAYDRVLRDDMIIFPGSPEEKNA